MADQQRQQPEEAKHAAGTGSNLTASHVLGEIVWLMGRSPTHRHFAFADLEWMIVPPMKLGQCRLFHGQKGQPVGMTRRSRSWTRAEAGRARTNGSPARLWLADLVAPDAIEEKR